MSRFALIALAGLAAFTSGCAGLGHEGLGIEYHPGQRPRTLQAPYNATYELFAITEPGAPPALITQAIIPQSNHVGFTRGVDGTLQGYAVGQKIPLPEGHYRWRMIPEDQRTNSRIIIDGMFTSVLLGGRLGGDIISYFLSNPDTLSGFAPEKKGTRAPTETPPESKPKREEHKATENPEGSPVKERKEGETQ